MNPLLFNNETLFTELHSEGFGDWAAVLKLQCDAATVFDAHGNLQKWVDAWQRLPEIDNAMLNAGGGRVTLVGKTPPTDVGQFEENLMAFHPWRKGPFELFGSHIDTEWRSDWKWDRLKEHVELRDRSVLDVGCGNGYYGWKMLAEGAKRVVGLDPFLLYVMQHEVIRKYAGSSLPNYVLPLGDDCLPRQLNAFDATFSMGVLYHRTSPIDHLQALHGSLQKDGQLVLETLVIDGSECESLVPEKRYAKMRNVWFLPSVSMLELWLRRTGFCDIQVVDLTATSVEEQRSTRWMTFESLPDFLDPSDSSRTIEGYPAPLRAIVTARKKNN